MSGLPRQVFEPGDDGGADALEFDTMGMGIQVGCQQEIGSVCFDLAELGA